MAKCTNCKKRIPVTTLLNTVFGKVGTEGKVAMSRDTLPPGAAIYSESPQVQLSSVLHAELSYFFARHVDANGLQTLVKRLDKDEPPICKVVHSVAMSPEKKVG